LTHGIRVEVMVSLWGESMKKIKKAKPLNNEKLGVYGPVSIQIVEGMGRGLIAERNIKAGEIILANPVIHLESVDAMVIQQTILEDYVFGGVTSKDNLLVMGPISLCNHGGKKRNCDTAMTLSMAILSARVDIKKGEQLTIDYGYDPAKDDDDNGNDYWEP
jgi:uncharacterized protein